MKAILIALLTGLAALSAQAQPTASAAAPAAQAQPTEAAAAQAQRTEPAAATPAAPAAPAEPADPATQATVIPGDRLADAPDDKRRCIRDTGTRLRKRDAHGCTGAPGESYDREAIDRTGAIDTADALRKLTTSGTIRRGH